MARRSAQENEVMNLIKAQTTADQCPTWCTMRGSRDHSPIWHVSGGSSVIVDSRHSGRRDEVVDIHVAHYLADPDGPTISGDQVSGGVVELAHHMDGRYRVIRLSPARAKDLARLLNDAAVLAESP